MSTIRIIGLILILLILGVLFSSLYVVNEGYRALVLRFGKMETNPKTGKVFVAQPGVHFKVPFIETVRDFDVRLQTLDIQSSRIVTEEKKDVIVDYYVKWRISNLPLYFRRTGGNPQTTGNLLQKQLNDSLRASFGRRTISELVSAERSQVMQQLIQDAKTTGQSFGVDVVDVRIKQIELPKEVSDTIFNKMRTERQRVATEHRSQGRANANAIRANADATVVVTLAKAKEEAAKLRAQGDARAANIYAQAYQQDPDFYAFYRSIQAYQSTFNNKNDILILRPDSQFFKYFDSAGINRNKKTASQ
ncbi:MAG: protease modulator HflC [Pseudomonadota bacterium]